MADHLAHPLISDELLYGELAAARVGLSLDRFAQLCRAGEGPQACGGLSREERARIRIKGRRLPTIVFRASELDRWAKARGTRTAVPLDPSFVVEVYEQARCRLLRWRSHDELEEALHHVFGTWMANHRGAERSVAWQAYLMCRAARMRWWRWQKHRAREFDPERAGEPSAFNAGQDLELQEAWADTVDSFIAWVPEPPDEPWRAALRALEDAGWSTAQIAFEFSVATPSARAWRLGKSVPGPKKAAAIIARAARSVEPPPFISPEELRASRQARPSASNSRWRNRYTTTQVAHA